MSYGNEIKIQGGTGMYTGSVVALAADGLALSQNSNRKYLLVIAETEVVVTLDNGGSITIPDGGHLAPDMAFSNGMTFTGNGTVVVNTNGQ
ncbi:hypothetical protein EXU30_19735 [Shewanella maritima]|uniref:Uncharacterized protein n=1 Tax=Shewanella maritima TaxID=2520507 RepID=A0A411PM86_9GAMM|nr:hypothetical protein [Shewanella maritima]QBF84657.1 hypothetical protein EXU30_19735 [Shewanella maritima]